MQIAVETKEVDALIRLLDDPDHGVFENVSNRLISLGSNAIPYLEFKWESNFDSEVQGRIEDVIHQIQFDNCKAALFGWKQEGGNDLFKGALLVSLYRYPDMETEHLYALMEQLRKDVWLELNGNLTSLEKVKVINHILFDVHGFRPTLKHHVSPQSSFMKNVLELFKGSPTTLAILYKSVADKLELPIAGIDLPHHFILGYVDVNEASSNDFLFYINPFSKGVAFGKGELERYIGKMDIDVNVQDLQPASNIQIIKRLLSDISKNYEKSGQHRKMNEIDQLLLILDSEY
ncbi:MAG: transglutaminase family protein [Flavobacteriales bacterium]|nr:transglutaminase family protein [Flavobacteriales bacterium]